jgi:hypothetical protein
MAVTKETATVYRGGGRRWLTMKAAIKAEAVKRIKVKYPTERQHFRDGYLEDPGSHWSDLPRSDVLLRRMCRLIQASVKAAQSQGKS